MTVMTSVSIIGLIAIGITLILGFAIRFYTKRRLDDLDGFQGIIDLDALEETEEAPVGEGDDEALDQGDKS